MTSSQENHCSTSLSNKTCEPCRIGGTPLKGEQIQPLLQQLQDGWKVIQEHHLEKEFSFDNFAQALEKTNKVGALAEQEGHHPDIFLAWGKMKITIFTHKIDGLSESDFILAAKIDAL